MSRWFTIPVFVALLALTVPASAQSSGGSFGGGSFSGGSRSGSSGGFRSGSRSSGGGFSTGGSFGSRLGGYTTFRGGGGGGLGFGGLCCLLGFLGATMLVITLAQRAGKGSKHRSVGVQWGGIDVSGLMLAIDWRARRQLQERLSHLARSGDTGTPEGLARLAREVARELRKAETSWLYAAVLNATPASPQVAEETFRRAADDARARFRHEVIRNADGSRKVATGPEVKARAEEGEGVVVITLLVAARRELLDLTEVTNADQVKQLLAQFVALDAESLCALEVIWSPAQEDDRMSTAELEVLYPELKRMREDTMIGRVFCSFCGGPYAAELGACPHCGAPNEAQAPAT